MNRTIYFAGAIRGDRVAAETMQQVIAWIQKSGHKVLTEHVAENMITDKERTAEEIEKRDIAWLDEATHVVAEISGASTGTGREIEYARLKGALGKVPTKVLCLYQKEREFYASPMVRGMDSVRYPNVVVRSYANFDEAKEIIRAFLA